MNKWTSEQVTKWTIEQMNKWTSEQENKQTNEQTSEQTSEQANKYTHYIPVYAVPRGWPVYSSKWTEISSKHTTIQTVSLLCLCVYEGSVHGFLNEDIPWLECSLFQSKVYL